MACVPDPVSAAPVTGYTDPCETEFTYSNTVQRIHEDPRVTKPYTETQWADINALGQQVDEDIIQNDIRLTMGGEPTFVSIDDMEGAEWDTEADSPKKRELGAGLLQRLRDSFGPGGALYYGQGKWYPGEPLPRWKFGCFWRKDGGALFGETMNFSPNHIKTMVWGSKTQNPRDLCNTSSNAWDSHQIESSRLMKMPSFSFGQRRDFLPMLIRLRLTSRKPLKGIDSRKLLQTESLGNRSATRYPYAGIS